MKKLTSNRDNSNNANNIVRRIGLSKFERNPVVKPSDLSKRSKEAPPPLVPHPDALSNQNKKRQYVLYSCQ